MDAGQALAELTEISSQIKFALIFDARGELIEATLTDRPLAESVAFGAAALLACSTRAAGSERGEPIQVELAYSEGSLLFVRQDDLRIVALTAPDPISGLAFFELRACLRKLAEAKPRWRRRGALKERWGARTSARGPASSDSGEDTDDSVDQA
ncbi:MAG: roadblock/LC7 domain-containing protein [Gaiellaceae bacterium]